LSGQYPNPGFAVPMATAVQLAEKVDKVAGKGLSDTNFTQAEKTKLAGVAVEATKNRADSANADKVHTHTIAQVTGLESSLSNLETSVDELRSELEASTISYKYATHTYDLSKHRITATIKPADAAYCLMTVSSTIT